MNTLTREKLKQFVRYCPETGRFFWADQNRRDEPAGRHLNGYIRISIPGHGVLYAHRLAWLWMTGEFPDAAIDHADGVRDNNTWVNLRLATAQQNSANSRRARNNTTGVKGVTRYLGKYRAQICVNGKRIWLGDHETVGAAAAAYERGARNYFGNFARVA